MWQALRNELHPSGVELVAVGLDTLGDQGCRSFIEAAQPAHPSLIDQHHVMADLFGVINIPSSIWIDESFQIVRPAEPAPAPPNPDRAAAASALTGDIPQRFKEMGAEVVKMTSDADTYHAALRDWVAQGADSAYAMSPEQVVERSRPRSQAQAEGHAHFAMATHLELLGKHDAAIEHFRAAHRLVPDSWTFRRQAWSLEPVEAMGPMARFWQGPKPDAEDAWPYEGDWLTDIRKSGPENYNERFKA